MTTSIITLGPHSECRYAECHYVECRYKTVSLEEKSLVTPKDLVIYTPLYKGLSEGSLQGSLHWC
jgi:hypothetical protein